MKLRALRVARFLALLGAALSLLLTPAAILTGWGGRALLLLVVVSSPLFFWAAWLFSRVSAGTPFRVAGPPRVVLGLSSACKALYGGYVAAVLGSAAFAAWLHWPGWWAELFQRGALGGPAVAIFFFHLAAGYHTVLWLLSHGAVKRCANGHDVSPFARSCPQCGPAVRLQLVAP